MMAAEMGNGEELEQRTKRSKKAEHSTMWDTNLPFEITIESNMQTFLNTSHPPLLQRENIHPSKDVFVLSQVLSDEECRKIIHEANEIGFGRTNYPKRYRGNQRLMCRDVDLAKHLWNRIEASVATHVLESGCNWKAIGLNPLFRLSKYCPGDCFEPHVDTFFELNDDEKSMYTVNIYLNSQSDFGGGKTRFYGSGRKCEEVECEVEASAGGALIFRQPTFEKYQHDGELVTNGYKYLLRSDIMYRKSNCAVGKGRLPDDPVFRK